MVRIEVRGHEWELELRGERRGDSWEVETSSGQQIGRVFKSTYTYSPPTHRGSRIARYHRSVKCWAIEEGPRGFRDWAPGRGGGDRYGHSPYRTRREALEALVREYLRRGETEKAVAEFAKRHPAARFRCNPGRLGFEGRSGLVGELRRRHTGGLRLRTPSGEVRIRRRELEEDRGFYLQVQLRPRGRWEAIANVMVEHV